uniref:Uncharacterized protein n=1 Tax=Caenorhabditis japonica TaxID=281687 RepID=A0A8R1IS24_CAEJA
MERYVDKRMKFNKPTNIFDKELLIFPTFHTNGSFLTLVKCPRGALVKSDGTGEGSCEISHIISGSADKYFSDIVPLIKCVLRRFATHFEPSSEFEEDDVDTTDYDLPKIDKYDKPYVILALMEKILSAEHQFYDISDLTDDIGKLKRNDLSRQLATYRLKLAELVRTTCYRNRTPISAYVLAQRQKIVELEQSKVNKRKKEFKEGEIITLD